MKLATIFLILTTASIHQSQSYIFSRNDVNPNLADLASAQTGTRLNIGLQVMNPKSLSQLYIDGMAFELQCHLPPQDRPIISLPGATGQQPELSTGPLHLSQKGEGKFVSIDGTQRVQIEQEAWEMIWVANRPTGSIICGFHLQNPAIRNDAVLPSGKIFLNFRVWTSEGLHTARNEKMNYERRMAKHMQEQKDALDKLNSTDNPIMKAMHFRNAAAANEMISVMSTSNYETIPMNDEDIVTIGDGLLVAKKGSIWTVVHEKTLLGAKETNAYLGCAILKEE